METAEAIASVWDVDPVALEGIHEVQVGDLESRYDDEAHGVWALGPATLGGKALATATAADPELRTHDGRPFRLSSLRGRKVLLVAWSSY